MSAALPQVLAEIAAVAGLDAAFALAKARGGTTVFIPASAGPDHWLSQLVGPTAAAAICAYYASPTGEGGLRGQEVLIPMASAARKKAAWRAVLDGDHTLAEVARLMGVHERTALRHVTAHKKSNGHDDDDGQGWLF